MSRSRPVPAPADLDREGALLWHQTQRQLRRQGSWQDTDREALERYVRAVTLYRSARVAAESEPFVEGSKGQLVAHPGMKLAREAAQDAHRYAEALLLTPEARKRHGIEAPAADELAAVLG
jgi:P27 family predicted phage terminase small subunit